jgi:hypothetical protein
VREADVEGVEDIEVDALGDVTTATDEDTDDVGLGDAVAITTFTASATANFCEFDTPSAEICTYGFVAPPPTSEN